MALTGVIVGFLGCAALLVYSLAAVVFGGAGWFILTAAVLAAIIAGILLLTLKIKN